MSGRVQPKTVEVENTLHALLAAASGRTMPRREAVDLVMKTAGCSERQVRYAAKRLGVVWKGGGTATTWTLPGDPHLAPVPQPEPQPQPDPFELERINRPSKAAERLRDRRAAIERGARFADSCQCAHQIDAGGGTCGWCGKWLQKVAA
jgi:hypothetical protein